MKLSLLGPLHSVSVNPQNASGMGPFMLSKAAEAPGPRLPHVATCGLAAHLSPSAVSFCELLSLGPVFVSALESDTWRPTCAEHGGCEVCKSPRWLWGPHSPEPGAELGPRKSRDPACLPCWHWARRAAGRGSPRSLCPCPSARLPRSASTSTGQERNLDSDF